MDARRTVRSLLASSLLLGCGGGGEDDAVVADDSFVLDYRSDSSALLELTVDADLQFSGELRDVPSTLASVGVTEARAVFGGDGQQGIDLVLSSGGALYEGETFSVYLQFSRANDGEVLDRGEALTMLCNFLWTGPSYDFGLTGDCSVRQSAGGYSLTIVETYDEQTTVSGTLSFYPVSNRTTVFTPGYGCASDQVCLSLDPTDYDADTGYCLPTTNLKSEALPCTADCASQLTLESGGVETCVCSAPCGYIETGGGGDPPVCDPAYGCIDF